MMNFWNYQKSKGFAVVFNSDTKGCGLQTLKFIHILFLMTMVINANGVMFLLGLFYAIATSEKDSYCVRPNPRLTMPISNEKKVFYTCLTIAKDTVITAITLFVVSGVLVSFIYSFDDFWVLISAPRFYYYIITILTVVVLLIPSNFIRKDLLRHIYFTFIAVLIGFSNFLAKSFLGLKLGIQTLDYDEIMSVADPKLANFPALIFLGIALLISAFFLVLIIKKAKTKPKITSF